MINEVLREIGEADEIVNFGIKPAQLSKLLEIVESGQISGKIAKDVFLQMIETGKSADEIVLEEGLEQISDEGELENIVQKLIQDHPAEVRRFKDGDNKLIGFFVGQIMKITKGKANPKLVNDILKHKLN